MRINRHTLPLASLLMIGLLTLIAYWPGLRGGFLFDDYGSLPALGAQGPVIHWATFWRYITSGHADPTGRPLALLSFLLNAHDWPANPFPFKCTNLILHLINGALLYTLLLRLAESLDITDQRARLAAMFGCALWMLHPLLLSTTLYIVQREAMLAATCSLTGLILWLHGRQQLNDGHLKSGVIWSVIGLGGFSVLGTLAKANGALLPLYAVLIEILLLRPFRPLPKGVVHRAHLILMILLGALPSIALITYVLWTGIHGLGIGLIGTRSWSIGQRLLTEPRVLMDYLQLLWLPRPFSSGLFNDQYAASTSLLQPATTLPAMLAVGAFIGSAWWQRRRHPALALAVMFYFAGQLLESTSIPLELYFEHRNYGPALLMFWPLGLWLADLRRLRAAKIALILILPLTLASMTHARAEVWGNVRTQGLIWAKINPNSPRAQANAAEIEMQNGHPRLAARHLRTLLVAQPNQAQLAFNLIDASCMTGSVDATVLATTRNAMSRTSAVGTLFVRWFDSVLPMATEGSCRGLDLPALSSLVEAGLQNPKLAGIGPQQDLTYLRGRIALAEHRPNAAFVAFRHALNVNPHPAFALQTAATLGAAGYPTLGLQMLDHYSQVQNPVVPAGFGMPMLHAWVLEHQHYWTNEFDRLRTTMRSQASHAARPSSGSHADLPGHSIQHDNSLYR